jgi:hypothetical protein
MSLMLNSVIILAGARRSGKTKTLDKMVESKFHSKPRKLFYSLNGKGICIYTSSPQEQRGVKFCRYRRVIEITRDRIKRCDANSCTLLILPFTLACDRDGQLNVDCITKPRDYLLSRGLKVHLVYLRKDSTRNIALLDELMSRLHARIIRSIVDGESRQAAQLWGVITRVDP